MSDKDHTVVGCLVDNPMLLITWNCRGGVNAQIRSTHTRLKEQKQTQRVPFFFIKVSKFSCMTYYYILLDCLC